MRLFGLEINRAPKKQPDIWARAARAPMGLLISEMSAAELREELTWVARQLNRGNVLFIAKKDPFKRVDYATASNPYFTTKGENA